MDGWIDGRMGEAPRLVRRVTPLEIGVKLQIFFEHKSRSLYKMFVHDIQLKTLLKQKQTAYASYL